MKHLKTTLLVLFLCIFNMTTAQSIQGDWSGTLNAMGQEIPLVFHFTGEGDELKATMDSPSQGASDIPVDQVTLDGKDLEMSVMGGQIVYNAKVEGDTMKGTFKQQGMEMDLTLNRGGLEKPGDPSLPSTEDELKALADMETGDHKYAVEDYFAKPASSSFQLSPEGTYLSYRKKDEKLKNHVYVKNTKTNEVKRVITEGEELIRGYGWANEDRLIYVKDKGGNENYHLFAVDVDGSDQKELTPYEDVKVNILELLKDDKEHMVISMNKNDPKVFDPYKINIKTGELEQLYENKDVQNPIMGYQFDKDGNLRGFSRLRNGVNTEFYYAVEPGDHQLIHTTKWDDTFGVIRFDYASDNPHDAYVLSNLESDKTKILKYDLAKKEVIEELFSHEEYDAGGMGISRNRNWEVDFYSYNGEKRQIIPVSDHYKKLHKKLTKRFPDYSYSIADKTDDESQYLISVSSDKLYGRYYSYDVEQDEIKLLFDLMPQLKEEDMATMKPISFKSRDGLDIHGYITLPKEAENVRQ